MKKSVAIVLLLVVVVVGGVWGVKRRIPKERGPLRFGATYMTMNNPYFVVLDENIKEVVESNGDILITRDPLQDQGKQNEQIGDMIEEGIDLLFLNPVSWKGVKPAIEMCKEKGVPVIVVDTNVFDEDKEDIIVWTITSDNYDAGVQCAEDMMKKVEWADIVILNHSDVNSTNLRIQGFVDCIENKEEYRVVEQRWVATELEVAMREMKDIMNKGVKFNVVIGGNDPSAMGCLSAMQMGHRTEDVLLYGVDGSPDGKAMIKAGYMEGTSAQYPIEIGSKAALTAYGYLAGKRVKSSIVLPVTLITKENLRDYDVNGWQ